MVFIILIDNYLGNLFVNHLCGNILNCFLLLCLKPNILKEQVENDKIKYIKVMYVSLLSNYSSFNAWFALPPI